MAYFDIRAFRFKGHVPANGMYVGTVQSNYSGIFEQPDNYAMRDCLPHKWRKAWDRATNAMSTGYWWHNDNRNQCTITLRDRRGNELAWLVATKLER